MVSGGEVAGMGQSDTPAGSENSTKAKSMQAFKEHLRDMFEGNPLKTRFVVKYRHKDGKLFLRATDDSKIVKIRTTKRGDLNGLKRAVGFVVANEDIDADMDLDQPETPASGVAGKRKKRAKKG